MGHLDEYYADLEFGLVTGAVEVFGAMIGAEERRTEVYRIGAEACRAGADKAFAVFVIQIQDFD